MNTGDYFKGSPVSVLLSCQTIQYLISQSFSFNPHLILIKQAGGRGPVPLVTG